MAEALRARLDAAVTELVEGAPWAPWTVEMGIAHEEVHFWRSAETMQTVACALPHLSAAVRAKAAEEGVALFASPEPAFEVVGKLYALGLRGRGA